MMPTSSTRAPATWLGVRAERPAWLGETITCRPPCVETPSVALDACADPAHEVVEALRWVRLRLGESHDPVDLAIGAASFETHDAAMHARIAESGLPVHAAHGVPPALVQPVERVHSATSLGRLLRDPFGFMAQYALHWKEPIRDETPIDLDALALTPMAAVVWHQRLWGPLARLHYTLLAALALVLLATLTYWNLPF